MRAEEHLPELHPIIVGDLIVDVDGQRVIVAEREIFTTSFEFRLLAELAKRVGETVTREELARILRNREYDPTVDRSLDVHISHLRQKLESDPRSPKRIRTVRGLGYELVKPG